MDRSTPEAHAAWQRRKRAAFRFRVRDSWATYAVDGAEGRAAVSDVSTTGVRLENPTQRLRPGTVARLGLRLAGGWTPVEVSIEVARETRDGFAGRFVDVGPGLAGRLAEEVTRALARTSELSAG